MAKNYTDVEWPMEIPGYNTTNDQTGMGDWGEYYTGVGGSCDRPGINPKYGYFCGNNAPIGSGSQFASPSGIILDTKKQVLINGPYKNLSGAHILAWRGAHWNTLMWSINESSIDSNGEIKFNRGGFQGSRGTNDADEWYISNVFEELTFPNEYYYNTTTKILYFYYNNTRMYNQGQQRNTGYSSGSSSTGVPPPSNINLVATKLKVLFNITGGLNNQDNPVRNITLQGLTFRDTPITYLDDHGLPSGGDWAVEYTGGNIIESCLHCVINSSLFTRMDGNVIFINGYNRYTSIINNDFEYIGDSVIVSIGYTTSIDNNSDIYLSGPDGRDGNQPRFTTVYNNMGREIGLYQKQSSMYFQAVSTQSLIEKCIF